MEQWFESNLVYEWGFKKLHIPKLYASISVWSQIMTWGNSEILTFRFFPRKLVAKFLEMTQYHVVVISDTI